MWESLLDLVKDNIGFIATFLIGLSAVLGATIKKLSNFIKEAGDVGTSIESALADDKITSEEVEAIVKEFKEATSAFSGFWKSLLSIFKKK